MDEKHDTDDNGGISFNDEPPKPGPELWIHRLSGGEEMTVTVFATKVRGVDTHWVGGRTQPHYRVQSKCPGCQAQIRVDWKGYLHVFCWERRKELFIELTPASHLALKTQVPEGEPLRGLVVRFKRTKAKNGRLMVIVDKTSPRRDNLPPEKDPMPSILRLWKIYEDPASGEPDPPPAREEPEYELEPAENLL